MNVVIDARESGTGTGRYVDKLIEYLHQLKPDYDITLLAKAHRIEFMKAVAPSFKIVESNYKEFTFAEQIGFLRQLNSLKADLVHFGMTQQPALYRGKAVTTIHDLTTARFTNATKNRLTFKLKQQVYKWLIKRVARKSDRLITPSRFVKHDVAQFASIPEAKIAVTYEAADKISTRPKPITSLASKHFILYVGAAQPHKNLKRAVDAFHKLNDDYPELYFALAGKLDANYQQLQKYASDKVIDRLVFTDFVSDDELKWLYENARSYVFPSLSEGFGLPGLEALAYGLPLVSSQATCLPEIYGEAWLYFDPTDADDMAQKIKIVLESPEIAKKLSNAGPKQAAKYSWLTMARQTLDVYKKALG